MQLEQNIYYKITKSSFTKITFFILKTRIYTNEFLKFLLIFAAFCRIRFAAAKFTPTNLPLAAASGKCDLYRQETVFIEWIFIIIIEFKKSITNI